MAATTHTLTLTDGRILDVSDLGPAGAPTIVWLPGTPEGRLILSSIETAATAAGLRIISIARPGYSLSTRQVGRTIASVVPDVLEACDALGVSTFAAMGDSGGGPHALACGALAPQRCWLSPHSPEWDRFGQRGSTSLPTWARQRDRICRRARR